MTREKRPPHFEVITLLARKPMIELCPGRIPRRVAALEAALAERILVIDGAMGTMIQQHELDEAGYRGERFARGLTMRIVRERDGHAHGAGLRLRAAT